MYVLVVAISGGDVVATSVVAKSAPSFLSPIAYSAASDLGELRRPDDNILNIY